MISTPWKGEATNQGSSSAWILTETVCTCMPFEDMLEGTKLIGHCRTMRKFVKRWLTTFITGFFAYLQFNDSSRFCSVEEKNWKEGRQTVFFSVVDPRKCPPKEQQSTLRRDSATIDTISENVKSTLTGSSSVRQDRALVFWQTNSDAIILNDSVPAGLSRKRVVNL